MFDAPFWKRIAPVLAASALALLGSSAARSQIIDLRLNVFYDIPSDITSGGTWELVAKSTNLGIAGMNIRLTGINSTVVNQAPRGIVNGGDLAGFGVLENLGGSYLITQQPAFPESGEVEGAFYGVGTTQNGEPGDVGHPFAPGALIALQDVPWAPGDPFVDGPSIWDTAATLLGGTFAENTQPGFGTGITGRVFTSVGTPTMFGQADIATIGERIIQTNFVPGAGLPDYNLDDTIDAADYVVWKKNLFLADGDGDGSFINDPDDYDVWREHFAEVVPLPGGSGSGAVPEPASLVLLFFACFFAAVTRRRGA